MEIKSQYCAGGREYKVYSQYAQTTSTQQQCHPSGHEEYDHWVASNNKAITYILLTMFDVLRAKFDAKETTVEILDSLQEIFGQKNKQACIEITGKYTIARMKSGTPMRDHVMMMTNYFTEAELHGGTIDEVSQVGMILNSLSNDFIQFTSNYIMNKLKYDLSQLLNELQTFESISKLGKSMSSLNLTQRASSSKRRGWSMKRKTRVAAKGKGGRPAVKSKGKNPALEVNKPSFKKSGKASKPKDEKREVFSLPGGWALEKELPQIFNREEGRRYCTFS